MKKIFMSVVTAFLKVCPAKTLRIMKLTNLLLLISVLNVFGGKTYSQNTKLNLDMKDVPILTVLNAIEDKSEFFFLYSTKMIDVTQKVDVHAESKNINEILDNILANTDIKYSVKDRQILLMNKNAKTDTEPEQQRTVTGKITDAGTKEPMIGVNIQVKGTTVGVITDANGQFSLAVPSQNDILVVSFIGYTTQEVAVGNRSSVDIELAAEVTGLDEVVVIGYGTIKRKDLTGAVASVSSNNLRDYNVARVDQAMVGKVAGVQIMQSTGAPGDAPLIRIRGIGSISAGAGPLYVIDGIPGGSVEDLAPSDIETIDVLKDASASAIYGSRGANGVIIVTTKRGKSGQARINVDVNYGWQKVTRRPEYLTAYEQAEYAYYAQRNSNLTNGYSVDGDPTKWRIPVPQPFMDAYNGVTNNNYDLLDYILVTAPQEEIGVSASGGTENFKYAVSVNHLNQDGIILNSNFKRYSVRANFDAKLSKRLDVQFNLSPTYTTRNVVPSAGTGAGQGEETTAQAVAWIGIFPPYNPDGSYYVIDQAVSMTVWHPVAVAKDITNVRRDMGLLGNVKLNYRITDDLKLSILGGINLDYGEQNYFRPLEAAFINATALGRETNGHGLNWINENTLDYNRTFGKHAVSALVGFTAQKDWGISSNFSSDKYPNNLVSTLNATSGIITGGTSSISEWSILSYLGRVNYNYAGKYYLTASYRTDGSSRFGLNKKWGVFPSAALAWRVSEENFLKDVAPLSELKLRASFGRTGNNNIGNYAHLATINYNRYPFGAVQNGGFGQATIANPNLTWETQNQIDFGVDISLLEQRLSFTVDYFHSVNSDLLLNVNIPSTTGFTTTLMNIGKVQNVGWEFTTSTVNLKGKFEWTTDFNISTYKNEVLKLGPTGDPIYVTANVTKIGEPIGMFYGWISDGIFMNAEELAAGPIYGAGTKNASQMGDVRWKDISGPDGVPDGIIDTRDRTIMGSPYPDFYYSMTNRFSYKNFSLNVSLQGSYGNQIFSEARVGATNGRGTRVRMMAIMRNYWKSPEDPGDGKSNSFRPNDSPTGNNRGAYNDRYLDTGTFLRFNNITLSYQLPAKLATKVGMNSCRLYASSSNPITISKNTSFNPEVSARSSNLQPGNDLNDFPIPKSLILGVNVEF